MKHKTLLLLVMIGIGVPVFVQWLNGVLHKKSKRLPYANFIVISVFAICMIAAFFVLISG